MALRRDRKDLKYYVAELFILVLGISMSFLLNEWRITQSERKVEQQMLMQFRDNLIADSTALSGGIRALEFMGKSANKLLDIQPGDTYEDSVAFSIAVIANFSGFYINDIAYQEMRSLGNSRMIKNDSLLKEIIQLYESDYDIVKEWTSADRGFLLNDLLPYMNQNFPFARGLNYALLNTRQRQRLMNTLVTDEAKYVIQTGLIMKSGTKLVYENALNEVRKILELLSEEIED